MSPDEYEAWWAAREAEEKELYIRCGGCGKFLPKDKGNELLLLLNGKAYHMNEKCITKGVEKIRKTNPDWNWRFIERENHEEA
jgi:hypothetical protein